MMRPCTGIVGIAPPYCTWSQLKDGTYSLGDVMRFNIALDELIEARKNVESN